MEKSSNKETLSSHLLSPSAPQNERALPPLAKEMAEIQPLFQYMYPPKNDRSTPTVRITTQAFTEAFWSTHEVLHRTVAHPSGLRVLLMQQPRSCCVSPASKLLGTPESRLHQRASVLVL
jgi:hypothetical protein